MNRDSYRSRLCAEEEEMHCRKNSLRKTKRTSNWAQEKRLMPVTCGNKTGLLDTAKLRSGEECIDCDGCWFAPSAFEELGGKGACRKWKSTILYQSKPLQTLFDKGLLSNKRYPRRSNTTLKSERLLLSCCSSDSSSAVKERGQESEEDDVKDDDWSPGSQDSKLETKERGEERVEAENVVDSEDETGNRGTEDDDKPDAAVAKKRGEEQVEAENGGEEHVVNSEYDQSKVEETENKGTEDVEAAADGDKDDCNVGKEMENKLKSLLTKKREFQMKLTLFRAELPVRKCSDVPPIVEDVGRNEKELMQSHEGKDGEREKSPGRASTAASSSSHISADAVNSSLNNRPDDLSSSPQLLITEIRSGSVDDVMDDTEEEELDETQRKSGEDEDESACEESRPSAAADAANTTPVQREATADLCCKYEPVLCTFATTSGHNAALLQALKLERSPPHQPPASDSDQSSCTVDCPSSALTRPNQLRSEIDELRRAKLKMQLRVLRLQEEYYTLKIKKVKN